MMAWVRTSHGPSLLLLSDYTLPLERRELGIELSNFRGLLRSQFLAFLQSSLEGFVFRRQTSGMLRRHPPFPCEFGGCGFL